MVQSKKTRFGSDNRSTFVVHQVVALIVLMLMELLPTTTLARSSPKRFLPGVGSTEHSSSSAENPTKVNVTDLGASKIQLVNGEKIDATITSVDRDGNVVGTNVPAGLKVQQILSLKTARRAERDETSSVTIDLIGGGKIWVSDPSIADEKVSFRSGAGINQFSLEFTRAIIWSNSPLVESTLKTPSRENDTIVVATADGERSVEGILESIDAQSVHVNYKGESKTIGLAKVKAVIMADLGLTKPDGSMATVRMVDDSKVVGAIFELFEGQLTLNVGMGSSIRLNTFNVVSIDIVSDRLLYLSDAEPVEVQEKSIFGIQRNWQRDRSVEKNPLSIRLAGSENTVSFKKGLGSQATSRLVFANTNNFDRFAAVVGIDAETGGRGDCQTVVRGDGIELWSKRVRGSSGPHEIDVDITGMKQIELLVFPGEEFDLGDHVDWGDARFLKTK